MGLYLEDLSRYGEAPLLWQDVYTVTMRLAGRVAGDDLTRVREHLHEGTILEAIGELCAVAINYDAKLPAAGLSLVREEAFDLGRWMNNPPTLGPELPLPSFRFTPLPLEVMALAGGQLLDLLDVSGGMPDMPDELEFRLYTDLRDSVTAGLSPGDGVVGVWRAWRYGPDGDPPCMLYVAEMAAGADAPAFIHDARETVREGRQTYEVEAYFSDGELPEYHRAARDNGALLWAQEPGTVSLTASGVGGAPVDGTGYWTDGRSAWPGPGSGEPSTVDSVGLFRARLALRKAGVLP